MTSCALLVLSAHVQVFAGVAQFEAGICGPPGVRALIQVQLNRLASPWFPDTPIEVAEDGFAGWTIPLPETIRVAAEEYLNWNRGPKAADFFFALSKADVKKLGLPPGDEVIKNGEWEIHLYRRWPQSLTTQKKEGSCRTVGL